MSGVLTGLAVAGAIAAAAAQEPELETPPRLELREMFEAPEPERPDVRTFAQRRRAARAEALGWLSAAADDRELATAADEGADPPTISFADLAEPSSGPENIVWNRPSLLTLGESPNQPSAVEWQRWQAAVIAARRWAEEHAREER